MPRFLILFLALVAIGASYLVGRPGYLMVQLWWILMIALLVGAWVGWSIHSRLHGSYP